MPAPTCCHQVPTATHNGGKWEGSWGQASVGKGCSVPQLTALQAWHSPARLLGAEGSWESTQGAGTRVQVLIISLSRFPGLLARHPHNALQQGRPERGQLQEGLVPSRTTRAAGVGSHAGACLHYGAVVPGRGVTSLAVPAQGMSPCVPGESCAGDPLLCKPGRGGVGAAEVGECVGLGKARVYEGKGPALMSSLSSFTATALLLFAGAKSC